MSLSRIAAGLTVALGAAVTALAVAHAATSPLPLVLALAGVGFLEIALGAGLAKRRRAAWSFAMATSAVSAVAMLLAVPAFVRGGLGLPLACCALVAIAAQLVLLIFTRDQF